MRWDPYSGDYGPGFLGMALGQCVYITVGTVYGDVAFGGNVVSESGSSVVSVEPRDAVKRRVFVADLGLKAEISGGVIQRVDFDKSAGTVTLSIAAAGASGALQAKSAVVWLKRPASKSIGYAVSGASETRSGWAVDLSSGKATVKIVKA